MHWKNCAPKNFDADYKVSSLESHDLHFCCSKMILNLYRIKFSKHYEQNSYFLLLQIEALPEVVSAVNGKVEVFLDGGVRLGTDAFKALALGAKAVFIGRPILWGLAYNVCVTLLQVYEIIANNYKFMYQ